MFCPKCGAELKEGDKFCSSCGARISEEIEMASVGARFVSCLIDDLILLVIMVPLGVAASVATSLAGHAGRLVLLGIMMAIMIVIGIGYWVYFFGNGQTPGMIAMKIKLCRTDGTYPIGYTHGFLRWLGMLISKWVFYLGFLWIIIDKNQQGWHDKIADTYVVRL